MNYREESSFRQVLRNRPKKAKYTVGISHERLLEVLRYDPESGQFFWRVDMAKSRAKAGTLAGNVHTLGYVQLQVDYLKYKGHRLAWFYVYGSWPKDQLDHINGNRADNSISNLREATASENNENQVAPQSNNKSGYLGVYYDKRRQTYRAVLVHKGKKEYRYGFATAEDAFAMYLALKVQFHPFQTLV